MTLARVLVVLLVLVAVRGEAAETVAGVATKARAEAKRWKADAILVEVQVHPQPDGTLGPGHGASFKFLSPSTRQALMVAIAEGKVMSMPMPGAQSTIAIHNRRRRRRAFWRPTMRSAA